MKKITRLHSLLVLLLALCLLCSCAPTDPETTLPSAPETEPETTLPETTVPETETETETETEPETEPAPKPIKKQVAITFDDGPSRQGLTEKIVDEFLKYNGKATFFVLGNLISSSTGESIAYAHENGFEIGIHAYTHELYFDTCTEAEFLNEINLTSNAIKQYTGKAPTLLRAPGGRISRDRAVLAGYPIINWSIDTEDWRYKSRSDDATISQNVQTIVENALKNIEDGDIILMHEIYTNSYEATCLLLERLDSMGFEFVTVTELLGAENLTPGNTIYSKTNIR